MRYLLSIAGLLVATTALPAHAASDVADIAQCVVDNDMTDVRTLLKTLPGSVDERRVGARIMVYYGGCDDNRTASGQVAWRERAEIANAALLNRLETARFDPASPPPRASWALVAGETAFGSDRRLVAIRQFGDCVVALAPAKALRLAKSARGGADEAGAIAALRPALNDCLPPRENFTVKRDDLRLILAEPLYHMISK